MTGRPPTRRIDESSVLELHIQPHARKTEVVGWHGDAVKIRVAAAPMGGVANDALLRFLADRLGVARDAVTLASGGSSRRKRVLVRGIPHDDVLRRLGVPAVGSEE